MTVFGRRMLALVLAGGATQAFFGASSINLHHGAADRAQYEWHANPNPETKASWLAAKAAREKEVSRIRRHTILVGVVLTFAAAVVLFRRPKSPDILTIGGAFDRADNVREAFASAALAA